MHQCIESISVPSILQDKNLASSAFLGGGEEEWGGEGGRGGKRE